MLLGDEMIKPPKPNSCLQRFFFIVSLFLCSITSAFAADLTLTPSQSTISSDRSLSLSYSMVLTTGERGVKGDMYVGLVTPNGALYTLDNNRKWNVGLVPRTKSWALADILESNFYNIQMPDDIPVGKYTFYIVVVRTGAGIEDVLNWGGWNSAVVDVQKAPPIVATTTNKPIPVLKSSYENKMAAGNSLGSQVMPPVWGEHAFADFLQDGSYSAVTNELTYDVTKPISQAQHGKIHFWKKTNGIWVDVTSSLLSDTVGCIHPRKAIVADFNGDGIPDVFFACTGYDASPFPGEQLHVLLSQAGGKYRNVTLPFTCYCHGGSAADFTGNGFADLVLTDTSVAKQPFYLVNNKNGTFTQDFSRVPQSVLPTLNQCDPACSLAIYSIELIDFDQRGQYDLWVAGIYNTSDRTAFSPTIFHNPGNNNYLNATSTNLPVSTDRSVVLDVIIVKKQIYLALVNSAYTSISIEKIDYQTLKVSTIYSHNGPYPNGNPSFDWMTTYQGNVVSMYSTYSVAVPL